MTGDDWVLFRASSEARPWLLRSAGAQTLLVGASFAALLMATTGQLLQSVLGPRASGYVLLPLAVITVAAFAPLPILARQHARRAVGSIAVDPLGLTLGTRHGPRRIPWSDLAMAEAAPEPSFGPRIEARHGPAELPSFHAGLHLRTTAGDQWEYTTSRPGEVTGLLAWLDVMGAGAKIVRPPSALAGRRRAGAALRRGTRLLYAALLSVSAALGFQASLRAAPEAVPHALAASVALLGVGCVLYVASYLAQLDAAREWLEAEGVAAGPPVQPSIAAPVAASPAPR